MIFLPFLILLFYSCNNGDESQSEDHNVNNAYGSAVSSRSEDIAVKAPPFTDGIYPCNDCHSDLESNPVRRTLVDMHDDISAIFHHDSENRWCLDCHDLHSRDSLRLANGKLIGFDESYKLCGQCHGDKLRDWKVGVHGKRTGDWNGEKQYLLCVHCHNPHTPRFESMKPMPPPIRQSDITLK